jgi:hypothetical protein
MYAAKNAAPSVAVAHPTTTDPLAVVRDSYVTIAKPASAMVSPIQNALRGGFRKKETSARPAQTGEVETSSVDNPTPMCCRETNQVAK